MLNVKHFLCNLSFSKHVSYSNATTNALDTLISIKLFRVKVIATILLNSIANLGKYI